MLQGLESIYRYLHYCYNVHFMTSEASHPFKDRQGGLWAAHCIQVHQFIAMTVVIVYYTYYERSYLSLFDVVFVNSKH